MNSAELAEAARARYAVVEDTVNRLTEAQLTRLPGPQVDWSVKDWIAHLTYWRERVIADVRLGLAGGTPEPEQDIDGTNAQVLARSQRREYRDVIADFERTHRAIVELIESIPDEKLSDPHLTPWTVGRALWEEIADEFIGHIDRHLVDLRAYLERIKEEQTYEQS